jgi:hypothetical protein
MACKYKIGNNTFESKEELEEFISKRTNISNVMVEALGIKSVPSLSPHQYSTDRWVGMAMRRVMQMASQEGFDRVAWITGEQSADRYDLSKQVDVLRATKYDDGTWSISANGEIDIAVGISEEEIENYVGKDVANKIINEEGDDTLDQDLFPDQVSSREYSGNDLKVGGEGMKTFYNSIVPKVAKKEAQRFDKKAKVEVIEVPLGNRYFSKQLSIKITPKMRNALQEAVPLFQQGGQNRVQEGELEMFQEQLEKTGLASSTTLLDSQEIEAELVKRGVSKDIAKQTTGERLAPNGKPTNLNQEQYLIVRTPAFKEWFGDWQNDPKNASKVLDENGEPMVVYHGTKKGSFNEFKPNKGTKKVSNMQLLFGSHFASNKNDADIYVGKKGTLYETFLNIKNPLNLVQAQIKRGDPNFETALKMAEELGIGKDYTLFTEEGNYGGKSKEVQAIYLTANALNSIAPAKVNKSLLDSGFDGVNYTPYSPQGGNMYINFSQSFIALEPNQVKSATDNNGEYSTQNNNISYSLSATTNGFVDTKTREVFINKDTANGETMLHEYNHLYTSWLKQNKSEVYNKGIALVNEELNTEGSQIQSVINFVKQNQPNLKGEALAEEILTQLTGERGIELLQAGKEGTILSWLKEAWESIKNLLGLSQYSLEEVMQMNIQKYVDAMAVDLVSGKNLTKKAEQPNPFTDQNGEVRLEHVLEFLEQESKTEAEPLTKEEEITVENILRTKGINSDELTDEVNRLFKGGSLNRNALENSSIFNKAEQIQVLQSKEYQDNLQKLANQEIKVEDNVEFERDFLVLDGTINKYGLYNTKNPLTIEKEIKDKVAEISNYEDFANAFNQLDYQGIVNKFNTEEDFAYKMFFKYSQLKKVKEEGKKQPNKKIEVENSLDISKLPLSSINMLLETSNEVWNESQQEVEQALTEIELQSISSGLDLQNLADFYTKKERAEFFELLESLRNLKRDTTEYNFSTFLDIYSNFYNLEEQDYQNAEEVDITHRNKELVRVRDYGMSEYDMFTKKDLIKIEDGLYQKVEKVSLENLYEMVYAEAVNNDNRLLPTTAYFNSLQIDNQRLQNPQNKEEVISNIKLFIQSSIGKLDLSNDSYSSDVAEQLLLYKYYFEAPMSFSDKTLNKTDLALIDNFDKKFNPFNFITLFQSNKLQERRKNSSNYKNFYKHFTIDQTGIRPIEEDSITLNILAKSIPVKLSKDFTNYAAVSRNGKVKEIVRIEKLLFTPKETYKKFYQNNYKALPNFKGEYQKIETDGITTSDKTDDFLRVGDKLYQRVDVKAGQAFYRQIPTNTEEFNIFYDFEKINNFAQDKVNPYIRRQENVESTNNFYTKKEIEEINKKHFDCS